MPMLRHATGAPVADNLNILTAGLRGPALLQDIWRLEKRPRIDREVTFKTQQATCDLSDADAAAVVANDRESAQSDLFEAIERGDYPRWALYVQLMDEQQAAASPFNPFDLSKVWPHAQFPLIEVGVSEVTRNPDNYFADVEQVTFSPANVVPGIGFSPDRMLQARPFSNGDARRYRLGVNFNQIPLNAPKCLFHGAHRDGVMRVDGNGGSRPAIVQNSQNVSQDQPPLVIDGSATHWDHQVDDDYFSQPGALFRLMAADEQQRLFENTARSLGNASSAVNKRHIANCRRADPAYGDGVARALAALQGV